MKLILTETIEALGIIGSEANVAAGYARNYLLPQKKAVLDTPGNRKMLEQHKDEFDLQIAQERRIAEELAAKLKDVVCKIVAKVSEENRLYGSITINDIINALASQDIKAEKNMVLLSKPIKNLGTYKVPIRIYKGVEPEITVEIITG